MNPRDALLRYPLFAALGPSFLDQWAETAELMNVQTGQTLFQAGSGGDHVYLVQSGRCRALRPGSAREVPLGVFAPGDVFGDYALLSPYRYTATCRACEAGQLLRLPLASVRPLLDRTPGLRDNLKNWLRLHALLGYLRGGSFLGFLTATSILPLLDRCKEIAFPAGHTIQADGLCADHWFFIRTGEVEREEPAAKRVLGPGECFGEQALLGQPVQMRATARTDMLALSLVAQEFGVPLHGSMASLHQTGVPVQEGRHRQYDWLTQRDANDCGPAALTMAVRGCGVNATLEQVRSLVPLGPAGSSLQALAAAAARLGVTPTAVRIGASQLTAARLPAVAHLTRGHYVALFEMQPAGPIVGDPACGVRTMTLPDFQQAWSGNLLLLVPTPGG